MTWLKLFFSSILCFRYAILVPDESVLLSSCFSLHTKIEIDVQLAYVLI